jgi:hypothetical protein
MGKEENRERGDIGTRKGKKERQEKRGIGKRMNGKERNGLRRTFVSLIFPFISFFLFFIFWNK